MRRLLYLGLLLASAGCHPLHERCRPECGIGAPCPAPEKKVSAPAPEKKVSAPAPEKAPEVTHAAVAQEVMLVPRTVYVPYVAQTPTAPVRLTSDMTVVPPVSAPSPPQAGAPSPPPVGAPTPPAAPCEQDMVDICKKLNQRLDYLEQCLRDRKGSTPPCPPAPLHCPHPLRRLLFNRCDTCAPGDPQCEPWGPSEALPSTLPLAPERMPKGNE
jgi:hypothetical protein